MNLPLGWHRDEWSTAKNLGLEGRPAERQAGDASASPATEGPERHYADKT